MFETKRYTVGLKGTKKVFETKRYTVGLTTNTIDERNLSTNQSSDSERQNLAGDGCHRPAGCSQHAKETKKEHDI